MKYQPIYQAFRSGYGGSVTSNTPSIMGSAHRVNMGNNWRGQKEGTLQGSSRYKLKPIEPKNQKHGDSKDEDFGFYRVTKDSVGPKVWWHELDRSEYSSDSEEEEDEANIYGIAIRNKTSSTKKQDDHHEQAPERGTYKHPVQVQVVP